MKKESTIYDRVDENNRQAIETIANLSIFIESEEIGAIALRSSLLIKIELNPSMTQMEYGVLYLY